MPELDSAGRCGIAREDFGGRAIHLGDVRRNVTLDEALDDGPCRDERTCEVGKRCPSNDDEEGNAV